MAYEAKQEPTAKVEKPAQEIAEKYTALQASHDNLFKDFGRAQERIQHLERRNADLDRRQRLEKLHARFPGLVDVDEECQHALYSLGGSMSDESFDAHIATVEKYAERAAKSQVYIPDGEAPTMEANPEKYAEAQKVNQLAVKIHAAALENGEKIDYNTARQRAKERLAQT